MFETAIVCTDLSSDSDALVSCSAGLAALGVREAILAHVIDVSDDPRGLYAGTDEAEETYQRQYDSLVRSGLDVRVEALVGRPAFSLEEVRRRYAADLLVIGCRRVGEFGESLSGSISADLLQLSETPLLLASLPARTEDSDAVGMPCAILRKVLCCVDPPDTSSNVFDKLVELIDRGATDITLLHVQDRRLSLDHSDRSLPEHDCCDAVRMARMRDQLLAAGAESVRAELSYGSPTDELTSRASSGEYSLIVLGNRAQCSPHESHTLGEASDNVIRASMTPVLLVPFGEMAVVG